MDPHSGYYAQLKTSGQACQHRGPDATREELLWKNQVHFTFHRLAIVDRRSCGMQPFHYNIDGYNGVSMCNGEIYNHVVLRDRYGFQLQSDSDSEIIMPLLQAVGPAQACRMMDGVFAFVALDLEKGRVTVGRDPFGVRSLYYSQDSAGNLAIASEMKSLTPIGGTISSFPPGTYKQFRHTSNPSGKEGGRWREIASERYYPYYYHSLPPSLCDRPTVVGNIRSLLENAVRKRLMGDRPLGCLLSGGLDSSIIAALLTQQLRQAGNSEPLQTFSIGFEASPDLIHARLVADHIGSRHHEYVVTEDMLFDAIPHTIQQIESYDITTVRAATPMYELCRYIKRETEATVIFSGEGSDEASGSYLYFHNAPDEQQFQRECERLLRDMHMFDVLRCDKSSAGAGLEVRVPFLDQDFLHYYMSIPPVMKQPAPNPYGVSMEKPLLREAFSDLLPIEVVWRAKDGMSDGISSVQRPWYEVINSRISMRRAGSQPREADYFRQLFCEYYPGRETILPYYWLPRWSGATLEPSGRCVEKKNISKI